MQLRPGSRFLAIWLALVACAFGSQAGAAEGWTGMDAHYESHWYAHDGGPADVGAIAQTADGYLWLGSNRGLLRFDGVRFEPFSNLAHAGESIQSPYVSWLYAEKDGGLWIGYAFGGVSHLVAGRLTHFAKAQGLPGSTVSGILRDTTGRLWVSTVNGVYLMQDQRFHKLPPSWGLPDDSNRIVQDRDGNVWVGNLSGIYRLRDRAQHFDRINLASSDPSKEPELALDASGRAWAAIGSGKKAMRGPLPLAADGPVPEAARWHPAAEVSFGVFDHDGAFWQASNGAIQCVDSDGSAGRPPQTSHSAIRPAVIFVDREGTVWVGASNGLLSYRAAHLRRVDIPPTEQGEILPSADSHTLLGTTGDGTLATISPDGTAIPSPEAARAGDVDAMHRAPDGSLWTAGKRGIGRLRDGHLDMLPLPTYPGTSYMGVTSFATDDMGEPWISLQWVGVFQHAHGQWFRKGERVHLPNELVYNMGTDPRGRLWFTYADGRVLRLDHANSPQLVPIQGLHTGSNPIVGFGPAGTWIVGNGGVALVDDSGVHDLAGHVPSSQPSGVLEWRNGDLWINAQADVVHIPKAELDRGLRDARHLTVVQRLDYLDGLISTPSISGEFPNMAATSDGRLWLARQEALLTLMPDRLARNPVAPPVVIEGLSAGTERHSAEAAVALPPGTQEIRIDYTGLSLAIPDRVRFIHELEGQDTQWSVPTASREVTYTNLSPGHYVFRVKAANEDGVWSETPASLALDIRPSLWQTGWFRAMCAAAAAWMVWAVHRWRMRALGARLRDRMEARMAERRQIARDLHDTLLQSTLALSMKFQALAERLPQGDPTRLAMAQVLDVAEAVMEEGRQAVHDLRSRVAAGPLQDALASVARQMTGAGNMPVVDCAVVGQEREINDPIWQECFLIASEALTNAIHHAGASRISIRVEHGARKLRIEVRDDGAGFVVPRSASEAEPGHWGLLGMRERAQNSRLQLDVDSQPGSGTRVTISVPARRAYRKSTSPAAGGVHGMWKRLRSLGRMRQEH